MAKPSVTRKRILLAVVAGMVATAAYAEYPTIDMTAVRELGKQLTELKKQYQAELDQLGELRQSVAFLNDISEFSSDIKSAIGMVQSLSLPIPNLEKMAAQTKGNLTCLMPNTSMKWGINLQDLNLGSICETSSKYRDALFVNEKALEGQTFAEQQRLRLAARENRTALLEDTSARALAHSDVALKQAEELNSAADQLQSDLKTAKTLQEREHVDAQIGIAMLRGQAQEIQILAQLLKLQGALAVASGLRADKVKEIVEVGQ